MPNQVTISGFKEFADKAKRMPKELEGEFDAVTELAADTWEQLAKRDAPTDVGFLKNGISHTKPAIMARDVVSASEYSAYMEFGTKLKVRVPAELSAYAAQFKGPGTGKDPKKFIFAWAKRKGIDPEAWYPIYLSIMRTGVNPHPFFFVQKPIVEKQFITDLKQILETEH